MIIHSELVGIIVLILGILALIAFPILIVATVVRNARALKQGYDASRYPEGKPVLTPEQEKARARKVFPWVVLIGAFLATFLATHFPISWPLAIFLFYR